MKFTLDWLRQHLAVELAPDELGRRLTMVGLELEGIASLGAGLERVRVGVLESVERHPNADRLTQCRVRVGDETLPIVCGASNPRVGDKVAVAMVGAALPNGQLIKKGAIRGVESLGMLCSVVELGLASSADGVLILPADAPAGAPLAQVLGRDDWLYEVNVTPNRGDCLGVRGIARDLAALLDQPLRPLVTEVREDAALGGVELVRIEDQPGCPRYAGRLVRGVTIAPSPTWLQQRLESVGLRPINNVVDVTNFVMMELGQPMHAFDLTQLALPLVVRKARPGESLTTLDGGVRELTDSMTVIADQQRALALAGIMGGEESGVTEATHDLFLESAYFEPLGIARSGRRLGLQSDSRFRFERGVDPLGLRVALDLATRLILELAGGVAGPAQVLDTGAWQPTAPIPFRHERCNRLGGIALEEEVVRGMLTRLGLSLTGTRGGVDYYQPPSHRADLRREEDLLEEVVRLYGYDQVPSVMPVAPLAAPAPETGVLDRVRRVLVGLGYLEAINYSFVGRELQAMFDPEVIPAALLNPLSEEQAVLRTTLAVGLVETARRNLERGNRQLRLAEVGRVFLPTADGGVEPERVAMVLTGQQPRTWHTPPRETDFYDLKGDLEAMAGALGLPPLRLSSGGPAFLHPGRKAALRCQGGEPNAPACGWLGQLHPEVAEKLGIDQPLLLLELDAAVLAKPVGRAKPVAISRYPAVERDFAFLVADSVPAQEVMDEARRAQPNLVREVRLFDVYRGEHVPEGMKSLAVGVKLQAEDRTLTEEEAQQAAESIVTRLEKRCQARLRQ